MSPVVIKLMQFVVIKKPPSYYYVSPQDERFFPTGSSSIGDER
jgi:hypothetical protein